MQPALFAFLKSMGSLHGYNLILIFPRLEAVFVTVSSIPSNSVEQLKEFNLVEDCERFKGVYEHSLWILAATLTACEQLALKRSKVAINW